MQNIPSMQSIENMLKKQRRENMNYHKAQHIKKRPQEVIKINPEARYVSINEYAKILDISTSSAYALVAGGAVDGAIKVGRIWRIPISEKK